MDRRTFLNAVVVSGAAGLLDVRGGAAAEDDTIVIAIGDTINSLDIQRSGSNRPAYQVAINAYDRLLAQGTVDDIYGTHSDYAKLRGELAESWDVAPDGLSVVFKLKPDAVFTDGTPVTADDVKWSFDRAVSIGGFPTQQFGIGKMTKPEQFSVIDPHTIKVTFPVGSKLSLPDFAVPLAIIYNSKVVKAHVTAADPWGAEYTHRNTAGSGAFHVERWDPGQQLVYIRNDHWKGGSVPAIRRAIIREIPSKSTRRALVERGDIHIDFDIGGKDAQELKASPKLKVASWPIVNVENVISLNVTFPPFQDRKVRQAVAWAVPYQQIFEQAAFGQGKAMFGAPGVPDSAVWPAAFPYKTDLDKAKALLAETAYKDGFTVPISIDLSTAEWSEPSALLVQESLGKIGITCTIDRIPGANWRTLALVQKKFPMIIDGFGGWLDTPDYYFFYTYTKGTLFNPAQYDNPEMAALVAKTMPMALNDPAYAPAVKRMIAIAIEDVPRIPLWQPALSSAMAKKVSGYESWFHRGVDARTLKLT
ncbi:ABC transporter substrate-binding protein [Beijerinckia sp. L45]|uniref:ABC transporter substrate-binding protein n=1 Tax=Beijerinckia sp. L45 TaxID=1641855 RepID=UPI00131C7106|nr:ABC transporter substrate-binding protein [Beijerinckia sp. L45]